MGFYVDETNVKMSCSINPCRNATNIRIGHPNRRGAWIFVCKDCLRQIGSEINEYFGVDANAAGMPPAVEMPPAEAQSETIESGDQMPAEEIAENRIENAENGIENAENSEKITKTEDKAPKIDDEVSSENEQEYYVCKDCGMKFKKPDELGAFKAHRMNAHRTAKA